MKRILSILALAAVLFAGQAQATTHTVAAGAKSVFGQGTLAPGYKIDFSALATANADTGTAVVNVGAIAKPQSVSGVPTLRTHISLAVDGGTDLAAADSATVEVFTGPTPNGPWYKFNTYATQTYHILGPATTAGRSTVAIPVTNPMQYLKIALRAAGTARTYDCYVTFPRVIEE